MSLSGIRRGVRIAAGIIGVIATAYGASVIQGAAQRDEDLDGSALRASLIFLLILAGIWIITEAIVGGFEQIATTTKERYERLQAEQPNAHAVAAQAVCETIRALTEQAAEDSPKVKMLHR